jgi:DegV family protein with EDD domain
MSKIAIITDTDSSLPASLAAQHHIRLIPITVHFGEEIYTTGVDLDDAKLFELIDARKKLPTTSAPPPGAFVKAFEQAFAEGADQILCICVSSKISATYQAAMSACETFPGKDITVIDALNLCMAQGFMALAAAEAAARGAGKDEILGIITDLQSHVHVYAALPTLKYLAMGGRMGKLAAGIADTLNIKPVLTSRDGKLELLEKVRTLKKAEQRLIELAHAAAAGKKITHVALIHVNNARGVLSLFAQLKAGLGITVEPILADFTPGLSVHAGSGVVGFVLVTE